MVVFAVFKYKFKIEWIATVAIFSLTLNRVQLKQFEIVFNSTLWGRDSERENVCPSVCVNDVVWYGVDGELEQKKYWKMNFN